MHTILDDMNANACDKNLSLGNMCNIRSDITNLNNKIKKYDENPHLLYFSSQNRRKF